MQRPLPSTSRCSSCTNSELHGCVLQIEPLPLMYGNKSNCTHKCKQSHAKACLKSAPDSTMGTPLSIPTDTYKRQGYLRVGGSMGPGDRGAASSASPMVSAIPAEAAPAMETTSPALALSSSTLPTPLRLKILVTLLSAPEEPAHTVTHHCLHVQKSCHRLFIHFGCSQNRPNIDKRAKDMCKAFTLLHVAQQQHSVWAAQNIMSN